MKKARHITSREFRILRREVRRIQYDEEKTDFIVKRLKILKTIEKTLRRDGCNLFVHEITNDGENLWSYSDIEKRLIKIRSFNIENHRLHLEVKKFINLFGGKNKYFIHQMKTDDTRPIIIMTYCKYEGVEFRIERF